MIETSKDILYLVISFCILWATVFLCWILYYVARILRNANQVIEEFRMKLHALTEAVNGIRSKVEHVSDLVSFLTDGAGGFLKSTLGKQAKKIISKGTQMADKTAKQAVDKAVREANKKIKKVSKKLKK